MTLRPLLIPAVCAVAGLAVGRFLTPAKVEEKVVTKVETVEVVKWKDKIVEVQGPVRVTTKTVTVPGPQGPTVTVEKVVEKEKIVTVHDSTGSDTTGTNVETVKEKVTDSYRPWIAAEGIGAFSLTQVAWPPVEWGVMGSIRVLGPLWLGAGVMKDSTWRPAATVRLEF